MSNASIQRGTIKADEGKRIGMSHQQNAAQLLKGLVIHVLNIKTGGRYEYCKAWYCRYPRRDQMAEVPATRSGS
jgi:hypothetical protein